MDIDNILNTINNNLVKIDNYIDKIVTDILFIKVSLACFPTISPTKIIFI